MDPSSAIARRTPTDHDASAYVSNPSRDAAPSDEGYLIPPSDDVASPADTWRAQSRRGAVRASGHPPSALSVSSMHPTHGTYASRCPSVKSSLTVPITIVPAVASRDGLVGVPGANGRSQRHEYTRCFEAA